MECLLHSRETTRVEKKIIHEVIREKGISHRNMKAVYKEQKKLGY